LLGKIIQNKKKSRRTSRHMTSKDLFRNSIESPTRSKDYFRQLDWFDQIILPKYAWLNRRDSIGPYHVPGRFGAGQLRNRFGTTVVAQTRSSVWRTDRNARVYFSHINPDMSVPLYTHTSGFWN